MNYWLVQEKLEEATGGLRAKADEASQKVEGAVKDASASAKNAGDKLKGKMSKGEWSIGWGPSCENTRSHLQTDISKGLLLLMPTSEWSPWEVEALSDCQGLDSGDLCISLISVLLYVGPIFVVVLYEWRVFRVDVVL